MVFLGELEIHELFPTAEELRAHEAYKAAVHRLIKRVGGVEAASHYCYLGTSSIGNANNRNKSYHLSELAVEQLEQAIGDHPVLRLRAERAGFRLVPVNGAGEGEVPLHESPMRIQKEVGDLAAAFLEATKDNRIDPHEKQRLIKEYRDIAEEVQKGLEALESVCPRVGESGLNVVGTIGEKP